MDTFNRVVVTKYWLNSDATKSTSLSPDFIQLEVNETDWIIDKNNSTPEKMILYYPKALTEGEESPNFINSIKIDNQILQQIATSTTTDANGYKNITTTYTYNGVTFEIEVDVNTVQTHNAADAIKSAWGVDVTVSADGNSYTLN